MKTLARVLRVSLDGERRGLIGAKAAFGGVIVPWLASVGWNWSAELGVASAWSTLGGSGYLQGVATSPNEAPVELPHSKGHTFAQLLPMYIDQLRVHH